MVEFEIIHKDLMGRIGKFKTPQGNIETPTIMPVINPNLIMIEPEEMRNYGVEMLITNAYIMYRNERLKEEAIKKGIHRFLGWELPIITDSGSYQLSEYKDVKISNKEIVEFQQNIGSDIGIPLDIPTPPYASKDKAMKDLEETIRRMKEARSIVSKEGEDMMLGGVVQGSTFLDLREKSAKAVAEIGFDVYPIGGLVPLLENYAFDEVVDIIIAAKKKLPLNAPIHLFGVGHPIFFSLAVALGCDFFDSAAYAIFAKNKRYITAEGTKHIEELHYLPCSCPICSSYSIEEIKGSEGEELLASHNLYVTFEEIRTVKQSIIEGSLWELCERRCRSHPSLLSALKTATKYSGLIEKYDPSIKHPFFYLSSLSAHRPEVLRYSYRLNRFKLSGNVLITINLSFPEKSFDHVFFVKPPFGPAPLELMETYPVGQAETPVKIDEEAKTVALQNTLKLLKINEGKAKFFFSYDNTWKDHPLIEEIKKYAEVKIEVQRT